jgi:hypothetical protein
MIFLLLMIGALVGAVGAAQLESYAIAGKATGERGACSPWRFFSAAGKLFVVKGKKKKKKKKILCSPAIILLQLR